MAATRADSEGNEGDVESDAPVPAPQVTEGVSAAARGDAAAGGGVYEDDGEWPLCDDGDDDNEPCDDWEEDADDEDVAEGARAAASDDSEAQRLLCAASAAGPKGIILSETSMGPGEAMKVLGGVVRRPSQSSCRTLAQSELRSSGCTPRLKRDTGRLQASLVDQRFTGGLLSNGVNKMLKWQVRMCNCRARKCARPGGRRRQGGGPQACVE